MCVCVCVYIYIFQCYDNLVKVSKKMVGLTNFKISICIFLNHEF